MSISKNSKINNYKKMHSEHPKWWEVFFNRCRIAEPKIFSKTIEIIKKELGNKKEVDILSIGAGEGDREIPILKELIKSGIDIKFDYLDIQEEYFESFKNKIRGEQISKILRKKHIADWQSFQPDKSYDLIFALFSLYGLKEYAKNGLRKIFNFLKDGGLACILHSSQESLVYKIFFEITRKKIITGELLSEYLIDIGIKQNVQQIKTRANLNFLSAIHGKNISQEGQVFLSYILNKDYRNFSEKEKNRINIIIKELFKKENKLIGNYTSNLITFKK